MSRALFGVRRSRHPSRAIPARVSSPRERVFFLRGLGPPQCLFFTEDFSACAASESAPVASGSCPSASRVRFLPVGSFSSCCPVVQGRVFKWSLLASRVFLCPTTRLLPRPLSGPQSLPSNSGLHQRRSVIYSAYRLISGISGTRVGCRGLSDY